MNTAEKYPSRAISEDFQKKITFVVSRHLETSQNLPIFDKNIFPPKISRFSSRPEIYILTCYSINFNHIYISAQQKFYILLPKKG